MADSPNQLKKYTIKSDDFSNIINQFYEIFEIHITFLDLQEIELKNLKSFELFDYCRIKRVYKGFEEKCKKCDKENLQIAKQKREVHIYRCHHYMLEGIVPLYDLNGIYLGCLFFGQVRETGLKPPYFSNLEEEVAYYKLAEYSYEKIKKIGSLLKTVSEYAVQNEIVKYNSLPWGEKLVNFIDRNLTRRITIKDLAKHLNKSETFITHQFSKEFSKSPAQFIKQRKMKLAIDLLANGFSVAEVAYKLGYYDEFHFSKSFKAYWKSSPKHFKKG